MEMAFVNSTLFIQMHKHTQERVARNKTMQSNKKFTSFQCECAIFIAMFTLFLVWSTPWNLNLSTWNRFAFVFIVSIDLIFLLDFIVFLFLFLSTRQNTHTHTYQKSIHSFININRVIMDRCIVLHVYAVAYL